MCPCPIRFQTLKKSISKKTDQKMGFMCLLEAKNFFLASVYNVTTKTMEHLLCTKDSAFPLQGSCIQYQ